MATTRTTDTTRKAPARERLLAAADELFYREGIHTVGIDRIIEHAGVAKASLYNTFHSKDELVVAYLHGRHARIAERLTRILARYDSPRDRLLGIFDYQTEAFADPGYRGCAFASAMAEAPAGSTVEQATKAYRDWMRSLLTELAEQAGAPRPADLARELHLLFDGSNLSARLDRDTTASTTARTIAAALLDAALAARPRHGEPTADTPGAPDADGGTQAHP